MKKGWIIAAICLLALGVIICVGAYAATGFDFSKLEIGKSETKSYKANEPFTSIDAELKTTDIVFRPSEDGVCSVVWAENEKYTCSVSVEAGTLKIICENQRKSFDIINLFSKSLSMTVYLPSAEYDQIKVTGETADVSIENGLSFNYVDVKAGTGKITIGGIAAGQLALQTSTGDISLRSVSCSGSVSITVSTGDIRIDELACASLFAKGSTGSVKLKNVTASECFDISFTTGSITFDSCDAADIKVKTTTGSVRGTLRSEKIFIAKASTGSVHVPDTASGGRCEITTSTGDINISIE